MKTFGELEDAVCAHLQDITTASNGAITVTPFPETQEEYERPIKGTKVYVSVGDVAYGNIRDVGFVVQDAAIKVSVIILSNKLRGTDFLFLVEKAIRLKLVGYKHPDFQKKFSMERSGYINKEYFQNVWQYEMVFKTEGSLVENVEEDLAPLLQSITIQSNVTEPITITDDEIDGGYPITEFQDEYDGGNP